MTMLQRHRAYPSLRVARRVFGGFLLAAVTAIPLGLLIGRVGVLRQILEPTISLLRPRRNSPLLHLPAEAPPLIVAVGGNELPELRRQSESYHAARTGKGLPGRLMPLPGRHHFCALERLVRPDGVLTDALASLVS
jgi:hypothetical protein